MLLLVVLVHVVVGFTPPGRAAVARPVPDRDFSPSVSTPASRTMIWSGFLILGFLAYHLLDPTFGVANPDFRPGPPSHNVVVAFGRVTAVPR